MNHTLRDALIVAMKNPIRKDDAMGVLYFLKGWLSVQVPRDTELIKALADFTEAKPTKQDATINEQLN